ncbi:MAG TPA: LacI family transcriptional regulator, partial [Erythrobacter sp.]|nr:LacI family transcriptional regulator [Erythrobacter sp.]
RLIAAGASTIGFLGSTDPIEFAARYAGAKSVADDKGVPIRALPTHLSPEHAADEIAAHLASDMAGIDGIFAASDML